MAGKNDVRQLVVIGAGPGGYAAAFHAADLGIKVTLIDPEQNPGGVCLYRGCIPTKALLHVAKVITDAGRSEKCGVKFTRPDIDLDKLRTWKDGVVTKLTQGLGQLSKRRKIEYIQATAKFVDSNNLEVRVRNNATERVSFERAILATGAAPARIPGIPHDSPAVMDSTAALKLTDIPGSMLVIGGGYIGLELASVYAALGTKITLVEMLPRLMTGSDEELISILRRRLDKIFDSIMLGTKVAELKQHENRLTVAFEGAGVTEKQGTYDKVLVAVGRKPNSSGIGLENTQVQIDDKGFIKIDKTRCTDDKSIFSIGDVAGTPQLAHKATHEGRVAAEVIAGIGTAFEPAAIPFVEYTDPEVAECGLSEGQAKEQNRNIRVSKFPWAASGRALTLGENEGLTKLIIDEDTNRILGAGIVGAGAGELIAEAALAVEMAAVASDVALTIHPHPTLSETLMEAAEVFLGHCIHLYRPR